MSDMVKCAKCKADKKRASMLKIRGMYPNPISKILEPLEALMCAECYTWMIGGKWAGYSIGCRQPKA